MICSTIQSIDKALVARRFAHARNTYGREALVQQQVAEKMLRLLTKHACPSAAAHNGEGNTRSLSGNASPFRHIVEFGCGTGCYSRLLLHALQPETLLLNDLCPEMRECICDLLPAGEPLPHKPLLYDDKVELYGAKVPLEKAKVPLYGTPLISPAVSFLPCDAETLDFPQGTDLITSCSTLQWFADTERFFTRCHHFLSDGGILAFSTFGKRNMQEIHTLTDTDWSILARRTKSLAVFPLRDSLCRRRDCLPAIRHSARSVATPQTNRSYRDGKESLDARTPAKFLRGIYPDVRQGRP